MTDVVGNPEEERRAEFYHEPWSQEAVSRYFYCKVRRRRPGADCGEHATVRRSSGSILRSCIYVFPFHLPQQIQQRRQELEQALAVRNT